MAIQRWCKRGTKVLAAISARLQEDAKGLRRARDMLTTNLDPDFLGHVFGSEMLSRFRSILNDLKDAPPPEAELRGRWGRNDTRKIMETYLQKMLQDRMHEAMHHSLAQVHLV